MGVGFLAALLTAGCVFLAIVSFRSPSGVYRRTALAFVMFTVGAIALVFLATPFLGSGAGLGVAFILYAVCAFAFVFAASAVIGASARHLWNALGR